MTRLTTTLLITVSLISQIAMAGLPPTSTKSQLDTSKSTTFDFQAPFNQFTKPSGTTGLIETGNKNLLKDPGFESSDPTAIWTLSSAGVFTRTGTAANVGSGSYAASYDGAAAGGMVASTAITIPNGWGGKNLEISCDIKNASAGTHTIQLYDGSNVLQSATILTGSGYLANVMNYPAPSSGTVQLRIVSTAANEPEIFFDDCYLGLARNVGSTQLISEWTSWTPTGSWTTNTTYTGRWRRVGDSAEYDVLVSVSGAPTAAALTINNSSECVTDTTKISGGTVNSSSVFGYGRVYDNGTALYKVAVQYESTTAVRPAIAQDTGSGYIRDGEASVNSTTPMTFASGDNVHLVYRVPCVGWTAQTVVMPDAQGWFAAASITGASASLSTTTQASFTEITNGSLTLTPSSGSAQIGIACASGTTNSSGATTCASANESLGVTVSVPTSGAYRVCASASNFLEDTGAATNVNATQTFKINRTSNANSTVITSGDATAYTVLKTNSGGGGEVLGSAYPFNICSVFSLSSGSNTFRLMYSSSIAGTLATNTVDIAGGVSQSAYFRVEPVNSQQQAILANSVSTSATNGEKIESLRIDASCTASPCSISSQSGAFTDVTRSATGNYSVNYPATTWSSGPRCVVSAGDANTLASCKINSSATTTSVSVFCPNTSTGVGLDSDFNIICVGPR